MEDNKTNLITLTGKANFAFNFNLELLKKTLIGFLLVVAALHPIITSYRNNHYQTEKVAIEKPGSQSINNANAPNTKQKIPTIVRKKKKRRLMSEK